MGKGRDRRRKNKDRLLKGQAQPQRQQATGSKAEKAEPKDAKQ